MLQVRELCGKDQIWSLPKPQASSDGVPVWKARYRNVNAVASETRKRVGVARHDEGNAQEGALPWAAAADVEETKED